MSPASGFRKRAQSSGPQQETVFFKEPESKMRKQEEDSVLSTFFSTLTTSATTTKRPENPEIFVPFSSSLLNQVESIAKEFFQGDLQKAIKSGGCKPNIQENELERVLRSATLLSHFELLDLFFEKNEEL